MEFTRSLGLKPRNDAHVWLSPESWSTQTLPTEGCSPPLQRTCSLRTQIQKGPHILTL